MTPDTIIISHYSEDQEIRKITISVDPDRVRVTLEEIVLAILEMGKREKK